MEEIRTCPVCGREFTDRTRKYCSPKCSKEGYRRRQAKYSIKRYHTEKENQLGATKEPKGENQLERLAKESKRSRNDLWTICCFGICKDKKGLISYAGSADRK